METILKYCITRQRQPTPKNGATGLWDMPVCIITSKDHTYELLEKIFDGGSQRSKIQKCSTYSHQIQEMDFSGSSGVMLSREEVMSNIGHAEQCWECGRMYSAKCYPKRPSNTCVHGQGRYAVRHVGGTVYRGSLRLVKVRYLS